MYYYLLAFLQLHAIGGIFMENNDMQNLFKQINQMLQNNEIPDELKDIVNNINNSSNNNANSNNNSETSEFNFSDIDINTIIKMKKVMDSINSNKNDPRTNLLLSLKPYLKKSRQDKVEQYIKLFSIGKAFEAFNSLGGDAKHDV